MDLAEIKETYDKFDDFTIERIVHQDINSLEQNVLLVLREQIIDRKLPLDLVMKVDAKIKEVRKTLEEKQKLLEQKNKETQKESSNIPNQSNLSEKIDKLNDLKELLQSGAIDESEFEVLKSGVLKSKDPLKPVDPKERTFESFTVLSFVSAIVAWFAYGIVFTILSIIFYGIAQYNFKNDKRKKLSGRIFHKITAVIIIITFFYIYRKLIEINTAQKIFY